MPILEFLIVMFLLINTKGSRHTYSSYLWHKEFDLGVIAKILGIRIYKVYGHTLEEKIELEYVNVREFLWKWNKLWNKNTKEALKNLILKDFQVLFLCRKQGSNLRPTRYECVALPTELFRHLISIIIRVFLKIVKIPRWIYIEEIRLSYCF